MYMYVCTYIVISMVTRVTYTGACAYIHIICTWMYTCGYMGNWLTIQGVAVRCVRVSRSPLQAGFNLMGMGQTSNTWSYDHQPCG